MPFTRELRELESFAPIHPFLSVYLEVGHNEASSEAMRVFVRTKLRQAQAEARSARECTHLVRFQLQLHKVLWEGERGR